MDPEQAVRVYVERLQAAAENDPTVTAHDPLADSAVGWKLAKADEPAVRWSTVEKVSNDLRAELRKASRAAPPDPRVVEARILADVIEDLEVSRVRNLTATTFRDDLVKRYTAWRSRALRGDDRPPDPRNRPIR